MSDEVVADLKLALTEAASNSVRHAYTGRDGGTVQILYELLHDRLVIEVLDEGAGFDLNDPGRDLGALAEGGLGIAIIRAIADDVEIGSKPGGTGSRLRFAKALT